jgi:hypothetical protein
MQKRKEIATSLEHLYNNLVKQIIKRSMLEEQGLVLNELGQNNKKWGDKLKTNAIININMARGLNKSYRNNSLMVRPPIGTP